MIMLVDTGSCACSELSEQLNGIGEKMGLDIRLQHEDIFKIHAQDIVFSGAAGLKKVRPFLMHFIFNSHAIKS